MKNSTHENRLHPALRALAWLAAIPLSLLALRLAWGAEAAHRMDKLQVHLREIGFDQVPAQVDPANDPWPLLDAATVSLTPSETDLLDTGDDPNVGAANIQWTDAHLPEVRALLARCQPAFDQIHLAVQRHGPVMASTAAIFRRFGPMRMWLNRLGDAALMAHHDGDDRQALHYLQDDHALARVADTDHVLIGHLVAIACTSFSDAVAEPIVLQLKLEKSGAARAEAIRLLEVEREQSALSQKSLLAVWSGEGVFMNDYIMKSPISAWWIRPLAVDESRRTEALLAESFAASHGDTWPLFHDAADPAILKLFEPGDTNLRTATFMWSDEAATFSKAVLLHFRSQADTSAAILLLAARLYQQTHGTYPADAAALVPEFLPEVPADPFSPTGARLRYRLDADGPTIWSVGENGTDEGGQVAMSDAGTRLRRYGTPPREQADMIWGAAWNRAAK